MTMDAKWYKLTLETKQHLAAKMEYKWFICNCQTLTRLNGRYRTAIRSAMCYDSEYWAVRKQHVDRTSVAK